MVEYQRLIGTPQGNLIPYDEIYALRIPLILETGPA